MARLQANGIHLEYDEHGDGDPLVLVMGLGGQMIAWPDDFVAALADRGFRVIRFDNRDVGLSWKSTAPPPTTAAMVAAQVKRPKNPPYLLSDMAADVAGLLDGLDIDAAHVVGASMGGMIGQTLAIEHPQRIKTLTSIMSNTGDRRRGLASPRLLAKMSKLLEPEPDRRIEDGVEGIRLISGVHFDEAVARREVARAIERDYDPAGVGRQVMAAMASPDRTEGLRSISTPTLVIHGLADRLVKPSGGVATARAVPGSRLLMFPDMAHDLPRVRWPEVFSAISANCARVPVRLPA